MVRMHVLRGVVAAALCVWGSGVAAQSCSRLDWSTLLGGGNQDAGYVVGVNPASGRVTVAGYTDGSFPTTPGAFDSTHNGGRDVFVAQFDPARPAAQQLLWATYVGGQGYDVVFGLEVNAADDVVLVGQTESSDFPTTAGAYDQTHNGNADAFVARFNAFGQLVYSSFLGGAGGLYGDWAQALAWDGASRVVVVGCTQSTDFPTTARAYDTVIGARGDAFVSVIDMLGTGSADLVYSTFLGGSLANWDDTATAVAVDPTNPNIIAVAGVALSADFPTANGYQSTFGGGSNDGFVAQIDISKSGRASLIYSTFLGGVASDIPRSITMPAANRIIVVGQTQSPLFPTTPSAFSQINKGSNDGFVAVLDSSLGSAGLLYGTFLGHADYDTILSASLNPANTDLFVCGITQSAAFPTTAGALSGRLQGMRDGFVSRFDLSGATPALAYSTFVGGTGRESLRGVSSTGGDYVHFVGQSDSTDYPTTPNAHDRTPNGLNDLIVGTLRTPTDGATWSNYGTGWPGTNGIPILTADANPVLGATVGLRIGNARGAPTTAFLFIGFAPATWDLGLGGTMLVNFNVPLAMAVPTNGLTYPLGIPCTRGLAGLTAYAQVLQADPGASNGVAFSRGLRLDLEDF